MPLKEVLLGSTASRAISSLTFQSEALAMPQRSFKSTKESDVSEAMLLLYFLLGFLECSMPSIVWKGPDIRLRGRKKGWSLLRCLKSVVFQKERATRVWK